MDLAPKGVGNSDKSAPCALVVDDEATNRLIIKSLLKRSGFEVVEAQNGAESVELFEETAPDIVFMDIMMPVMDGYEAASLIKAKCGERFVPLIFLTALTDNASLARSIEAGGDDFLTKPINATLLKAKIHSMSRIRDLNRKLRAIYDHMRHEEEIAEKVFGNIVQSGSSRTDLIRHHLRPASLFNGDMMLTELSPSGDLNILLADFTGHGLSAALGAMPAADAFRAVSRKGFAPELVLAEMNKKLNKCLPKGMFMAVHFVSINLDMERVVVANCGMPDMLIVDGETRQIKQRISSAGLPLGIVAEFNPHDTVQYLNLNLDDRIVLVSDGVVEAENSEGVYFGDERLNLAVESSADDQYCVDNVIRVLTEFYREAEQRDDVSIVEIPFKPELVASGDTVIPHKAVEKPASAPGEADSAHEFELAVKLQGDMLGNVDPVPTLLTQVRELANIKDEDNVLYTILAELYNNALDHGVLGLDSELKASAEGFAKYYLERERRLLDICDGRIEIAIKLRRLASGGRVILRIEDSGKGFDIGHAEQMMAESNHLSRRGIPLVRELADSMTYRGCGNIVEAVYSWSSANPS